MVAQTQNKMEKAGRELGSGLLDNTYRSLGMESATGINLRNIMSQTEEYLTQNKLLDSKMTVMSNSMVSAREAANDTLELAIQNMKNPTPTTRGVKVQAEASIQKLTQSLSAKMGNQNLFSGINSSDKALHIQDQEIDGLGMTPLELVFNDVLGGTVPNSVADVNTAIDALDDFFESNNAAPSHNYEGTIYQGTPLEDGAGNPNPRVISKVDEGETLEYGVQANDEGTRTILKGLYALSAINVDDITDKDAFEEYMTYAVTEIERGVSLLQDSEARLGTQHELLGKVQDRQELQLDILNKRLVDMEHVDPYEAQIRFTMLETQLNATYNVSAKMGQMSFTNWMR